MVVRCQNARFGYLVKKKLRDNGIEREVSSVGSQRLFYISCHRPTHIDYQIPGSKEIIPRIFISDVAVKIIVYVYSVGC